MALYSKELDALKKKRDEARQRLFQQYDKQNAASALLAQQEQKRTKEAERDAATTTGDELSTGFAAGAPFGGVGAGIGALAGLVLGQAKTYDYYKNHPEYAKDTPGATGNAALDAWINPATTARNIGKGLAPDKIAQGAGSLYNQHKAGQASAPTASDETNAYAFGQGAYDDKSPMLEAPGGSFNEWMAGSGNSTEPLGTWRPSESTGALPSAGEMNKAATLTPAERRLAVQKQKLKLAGF